MLDTADYALVTSSLHYNDSLVTWTVVHMTTAKFNEVLCASTLVKSGLENQYYSRRGSAALTMRHPSIRKSWQ
jgi:hypothetical protein